MCGRYTPRSKLNLLRDQFAAELADGTEWEPRYNIPPTASVPAIWAVNHTTSLSGPPQCGLPTLAHAPSQRSRSGSDRADECATRSEHQVRRQGNPNMRTNTDYGDTMPREVVRRISLDQSPLDIALPSTGSCALGPVG